MGSPAAFRSDWHPSAVPVQSVRGRWAWPCLLVGGVRSSGERVVGLDGCTRCIREPCNGAIEAQGQDQLGRLTESQCRVQGLLRAIDECCSGLELVRRVTHEVGMFIERGDDRFTEDCGELSIDVSPGAESKVLLASVGSRVSGQARRVH